MEEQPPRKLEEPPFGLRVADDCFHLEENPTEMQVLHAMIGLIVQDISLPRMAEELNRRGFETREGKPWNAQPSAPSASRILPTHIIAGDMQVYPQIAIAAGTGGVVRLSIEVQNGAVTGVSAVSASTKAAKKWLTASARACASSWRFAEGTGGTVPAEFVYESTAPGTATLSTSVSRRGMGSRYYCKRHVRRRS